MTRAAARIRVYDEFNVWQFLDSHVSARLPLRNVSWRNPLGGKHVNIESIPVDFFVVGEQQQQQHDAAYHSENELPPHERAYVSVIVVKCEDANTLRMGVRQRLQQWIESCNETGDAWLIVYTPLGAKDRSEYQAIFRKLSSEFCLQQSGDSCCKIEVFDAKTPGAAPGQQQQHEDQWVDFFAKIRDRLIQTFDGRRRQYDNEIRRLDNQRATPAWNFPEFFAVKESLAFMFEKMRLFVEASRQYDELEALAGGLDDNDELRPDTLSSTTSILDVDPAAFREALAATLEPVSALAFRQYLFARQSQLLFSLAQPSAVVVRALSFISHCYSSGGLTAEALPEGVEEEELGSARDTAAVRAETWAFVACRDVAEACKSHNDDGIGSGNSNDSRGKDEDTDFFAGLAQLQTFARARLQRLGELHFEDAAMVREWRPTTEEWDPRSALESFAAGETKTEVDSGSEAAPGAVADVCLREALSSQLSFETAFLELTGEIAGHYTRAGRLRFAAKFYLEHAHMLTRRGDHETAAQTLLQQLKQYQADGWTLLTYRTLRQIAHCQRCAPTPVWRAYVLTALNLLEPDIARLTPSADVSKAFLADVVRGSTMLDEPMERPLVPLLNASVALREPVASGTKRWLQSGSTAASVQQGQQMRAWVQIDSSLPDPVTFDRLELSLVRAKPTGRSGQSQVTASRADTVKMELENCLVEPGTNVFVFSQLTIASGKLVCDQLRACLGNVSLCQDLGRHKLSKSSLQQHKVVVTPCQSSASLAVTVPPFVVPNQPRHHVHAIIASNLDSVSDASLHIITPKSSNVIFGGAGLLKLSSVDDESTSEGTKCEGSHDHVPFTLDDDGVVDIPNFGPGTVAHLWLPVVVNDAALAHTALSRASPSRASNFEVRLKYRFRQNPEIEPLSATLLSTNTLRIQSPIQMEVSAHQCRDFTFVRIRSKNTSTVPVVLMQYQLTPPKMFDIDQDPNECHPIEGGVPLHKGRETCYCFRLVRSASAQCSAPPQGGESASANDDDSVWTGGSFCVQCRWGGDGVAPPSGDKGNCHTIAADELVPTLNMTVPLDVVGAADNLAVFETSLRPTTLAPSLRNFVGSFVMCELNVRCLVTGAAPVTFHCYTPENFVPRTSSQEVPDTDSKLKKFAAGAFSDGESDGESSQDGSNDCDGDDESPAVDDYCTPADSPNGLNVHRVAAIDDIRLQFEVDTENSCWVLCGRKRGELIFQPEQLTATVQVALLPVCPGNLPLPSVRLFHAGGSEVVASQQRQFATHIAVLPTSSNYSGVALPKSS